MKTLDFSIFTTHFDLFLQGFLNTLKISVLGLVFSFILGVIIAVMRIAPVKVLNIFGTCYVEFIRNIPLIIIIFFFYFGLSSYIDLNGFEAGTIGLSIYTSSFIAEAVRAGIQSIDKGQMEAARSSGLSYLQAMRFIILPQAIKIVIPPIGNQFINLVKNTSILTVVAGGELMYAGDIISQINYRIFDTYILVGLCFLALTIPLSLFVNHLEHRLARKN
ncbi:amino acid ABC transporter permease [Lederbergia graminis]|uniref:Amino acid ABC transporter permease n=1 Tax=Lederbergia graminis TaxID=735518 RepID=A0ABW0LN79_9BACI